MEPTIETYIGDSLEVLKNHPENSFTAIVTDPPYALEFMGKGWDKVLPSVDVWRECLRVLKPGGILLAFGGTRTYHRLTCSIEDAGFEVRDCLMWLYGSGFPKALDVSKAIDKAAGAERKVIGPGRWNHVKGSNDKQQGCLIRPGGKHSETTPTTDAAKLWHGYGTALKPAWEPIVLAMKPLDGTFAANALAHGVAGINVDGCRIGHNEPEKLTQRTADKFGRTHANGKGWRGAPDRQKLASPNPEGRWPANLILDEEAGAMLDEQSGPKKGSFVRNRTDGSRPFNNDGKDTGYTTDEKIQDPTPGGASRFFYCAKAGKKDRGEGNKHPTVKPSDLMRYLVRMVTMPEGTRILDPFMGSGSTGVACVREGVSFMGIDLDPEYVAIAQKRIEHEKD